MIFRKKCWFILAGKLLAHKMFFQLQNGDERNLIPISEEVVCIRKLGFLCLDQIDFKNEKQTPTQSPWIHVHELIHEFRKNIMWKDSRLFKIKHTLNMKNMMNKLWLKWFWRKKIANSFCRGACYSSRLALYKRCEKIYFPFCISLFGFAATLWAVWKDWFEMFHFCISLSLVLQQDICHLTKRERNTNSVVIFITRGWKS